MEGANVNLEEKRPQIEEAVRGIIGKHQRMMLSYQLRHIEFSDRQIEELSQEISRRLSPFEEAMSRIDAVPGIGRTTAETVIAEIGVDMSHWPTHAHISSWAGLCPGNDESAGKRRSGKTREGNLWLKEALVEAAQTAGRTKANYLFTQYHRLVSRLGKKKAAVAYSMLVIIYYTSKDGTEYKDLGANY